MRATTREPPTPRRPLPKAEAVVVGDLASIAATKDLAAQVNALGPFDAVIHNAAVGYREEHRLTSDGVPHVFAINTLAPYILTMLIDRPKRLVYLSSGMHERANANLDDILWRKRRWDGSTAYAESKLHDVMLAFTVARLWQNVLSNAMTPGWVPTKMGGAGAPDDIDQAHLTQAWLATSDDAEAKTTGGYFYHLKRREPNREAREDLGAGQAHRHLPGDFRSQDAVELRRRHGAAERSRPLPAPVDARQRMRAFPDDACCHSCSTSAHRIIYRSPPPGPARTPLHCVPGRLVLDPVLKSASRRHGPARESWAIACCARHERAPARAATMIVLCNIA